MYLPDEKSIVGRNLQILINQKNWSIKQAAKELNYDRINLSKMLSGSQNFRIKTLIDLDSTTVSHIINGRRNNPTISTLHQFAEYSNTSLSELFKTEIDKIIIKQKEEDSI